MNCPWCNYEFKILLAKEAVIPDFAPCVCENCGEVSFLLDRKPPLVKCTPDQLEQLKKSPAWANILGPFRKMVLRRPAAQGAHLN